MKSSVLSEAAWKEYWSKCYIHWSTSRQDYDSVKLSAEDLVRQTVTIAEEFLLLLIHVVSERYLEGVGEVDRKAGIKREIIHQLCIQPMAHSELTKALPEDVRHTSVQFTKL